MKVWIIYIENNSNAEPAIVGVYATEALAGEARAKEIITQTEYGNIVWAETDKDGKIDWDVDIHVEEFEVQQ